jgi:hypothetical protein
MYLHYLRVFIPILLLSLLTVHLNAQNSGNYGQVSGSFEFDGQLYQEDEKLGISDTATDWQSVGMNAFGNIIYRLGNFSAGVRYEAYLPPMLGYDAPLEGQGFANRWARYNAGIADVTVGNFYDQFGLGMIFRTYEEWSLGFDNSVDGVRLILKPYKGVTIKGIWGVQRYYWEKYTQNSRGIIKGADIDLYVNDIFNLEDLKTKITLGAGILSRYQADLDPLYKLPENVSGWSGRLNLSNGGFFWQTEYAYKINDPNAINGFIYKEGQGIYSSMSYSQKGFGVSVSAKWIDNMGFKSDRTVTGLPLEINFLPPNTKTHTYNLTGFYPYATQPNGEAAIQATINYKIPKKIKIGW